MNLSSNLIGSSNDETNFPHKLLLTNTQVSKIHKAFSNGSSANIKLSKTQLSKMIQSGGLLGLLETFLNSHKSLPFKHDKMAKKIINEADKLSKKVTLNDITKTTTDSNKFLKN